MSLYLNDLTYRPFQYSLPERSVSVHCLYLYLGNTGNPHDLTRTPGGSSGGEGALIGAGGSVLGTINLTDLIQKKKMIREDTRRHT